MIVVDLVMGIKGKGRQTLVSYWIRHITQIWISTSSTFPVSQPLPTFDSLYENNLVPLSVMISVDIRVWTK